MGFAKTGFRAIASSLSTLSEAEALTQVARWVFSINSTARKEVKARAQVMSYGINKDGTPCKRATIAYKCQSCGKLASKDNYEVDHIKPISKKVPWPTDNSEEFLAWFKSVLCDAKNLQVLCKPCHHEKSGKEATKRAQIRRKKSTKADPT